MNTSSGDYSSTATELICLTPHSLLDVFRGVAAVSTPSPSPPSAGVLVARNQINGREQRRRRMPNRHLLAREGIQEGASLNNIILTKYLGDGGYGCVFKCHDVDSPQHEYVKVESNVVPSPQLYHEIMCLRELRDNVQETHHFLQIIENGTTPSAIYVVMELGVMTLRDARRSTRHDRLSAKATIMLSKEMLNALHAMHRIGWQHRDVKPANCCLRWHDGCNTVALIDFGLSRKLGADDRAPFRGTLRYASARDTGAAGLIPIDDIVSLMYCAYEMHAGHLPWRIEENHTTVDMMKRTCKWDELSTLTSLRTLREFVDDWRPGMPIDYDKLLFAMEEQLTLLDDKDYGVGTTIVNPIDVDAEVKLQIFKQ